MRQDLSVRKGLWVPPVPRDLSVRQDLSVRKGLSDPKDPLVLKGLLVLKALPVPFWPLQTSTR